MHNPYQAPVANLDVPFVQEPGAEAEVGGFWLRLAAQLLDVLFMLPFIGLNLWLGSVWRYFYAVWVIPGTLIGMFLTVYLVRRYGGSPGKLVLKLRIQMKDGARITTKAALIRVAPLMVLSLLTSIGTAYAAILMDEATYSSIGFMQRSAVLGASAPIWSTLASTLMQVWMLASIPIMLLNKRRRALHDFLAGTAVVRV